LLTGLAAAAPELHATLYSPAPARHRVRSLDREPAAGYDRLPSAEGTRASPLRQYWRTFRTGRAARRDGVQCTTGCRTKCRRDLPGTGIPGIVTFHDLLFERYPDLFPVIDRMSYRWRYRWSAEHATRIVAVSGQTRDGPRQVVWRSTPSV
jgi:hypothetical protein